MELFAYENWPYFFIAILAVLIVINVARCHRSDRTVFKRYSKRCLKKPQNTQPTQVTQVTQIVPTETTVIEQNGMPVGIGVTAPAQLGIVRPVLVTEGFRKRSNIPGTFTRPTTEQFAPIKHYPSKTGANVGALGCPNTESECVNCYKNLNDQINLGVNNYLFPYCNNNYACVNGCNIQDQINSHQFNYRIGAPTTELEQSNSGLYVALNADKCSQNCPSAGILPVTQCNSSEPCGSPCIAPAASCSKKM